MIRFEALGRHDYAVYVEGESDAIGKAGMVCGDAWFQARASLGGGIVWEKTMLDAVRVWAETRLKALRARRMILREAMYVAMLYDGKERENEDGIFTQ